MRTKNLPVKVSKSGCINWKLFSPAPQIGVDEAGRGCLAGPVFASAVILKKEGRYVDSKSLSPNTRAKLAQQIMNENDYGIGRAEVEEIEALNILQASLLAMKRAVLNLSGSIRGGHVLVDGAFTIPGLAGSFQQTAFIKGDQKLSPISAASILAKVKRDEWISLQDQKYPEYHFARHKGYAVSQHRQAIRKYGPCPLHRKTFSGVKEFL